MFELWLNGELIDNNYETRQDALMDAFCMMMDETISEGDKIEIVEQNT
jgi:hypothetical protein